MSAVLIQNFKVKLIGQTILEYLTSYFVLDEKIIRFGGERERETKFGIRTYLIKLFFYPLRDR